MYLRLERTEMKGFPVHKKDSNIHVLEHAADSYFGSFPGVNGATTGVVKVNGVDETIPLNAGQNVPTPFCHRFSCAAKAYDQGAMDAFNLADQANCGASPYACYQEGTQALIPNYWALAQQ